MLGKRTRPSVKRLLDPIIPGDRSMNPDPILSPTSPLEFKFRSPNVWKNQDSGRIGLAIVAALEKSDGTGDSEFRPKVIVGSCNLTRSDPIPIGSSKTEPKPKEDLDEIRCSESYTCVTYHGPDQVSRNRVYCDGGDLRGSEYDRKRLMNVGVFYESPPRLMDEISSFRSSDFLSSCHLCRKMLHGKDIYMYRGEKAFCSVECRYQQIASDERKEKCRSGASKPSDIPLVLYSGSKLFTPGIVAA